MTPKPTQGVNPTTLELFRAELQALMARYPTVQLEVTQNIQARDMAVAVPAAPKKKLWPLGKKSK